MYNWISRICQIILALLSFIKFTTGTVVQQFFQWLTLNFIYDFVAVSYNFLVPLLIVGILVKWIRNPKVLAVIGVLVFLFVTFALK